MGKILTVTNLGVSFGNHVILKDLSFELQSGEAMAIIGPNGSGKTVLLKVLLGLIPSSHGSYTWATHVRIGYVPQKIHADRSLPINLHDFLEAKARLLHLTSKDLDDVCETVNIGTESLKTPIGYLSGGQFQKALIAFALLGHPNVILFDEPTASLDELSEEHIYELIRNLQLKRGITTILVSHDLSIVYQHANKVLCLNKENICFGTPQEALTPKILSRLYSTPHKYYQHLHHHHEDE